MFSLTIIDLARLDSEHVAQNYTIHTRAADRLAHVALSARIAVLLLLGAALATAITSMVLDTVAFRAAAAVSSALALIGYTLAAGYQFERRIHGHRSLAHRLWLVAERYRSLLAEVEEGIIDRTTLPRRREDLIQQLHAIYDEGIGVDQPGFERERLPKVSPDQAA